ncbi:poly-gamma-glutamate hydrolase family protein [Streptomyces yangpuensis]|uniref:poly-gamma-glutamate hydrolase family protein n=1 Tax=Streptomyces yangpuensis TaxID=1648182 RepID=UPI0036774F26
MWELARSWVEGWAVSRRVARPVDEAWGLSVRVGAPGQAVRHVLLDADAGTARGLVGAVCEPAVWIKGFVEPHVMRTWFPPAWIPTDPGFLMAVDLRPAVVRAPDGYSVVTETADGVVGNSDLHVTSTLNDDPVARSMAAGSANVLSLHGCTATQAGLPAGAKGVVVGGANGRLRALLADRLDRAGFLIATGDPEHLNGNVPGNICNRTLTGEGGGRLEMTYDLRKSLFSDFGGAPNATSPTRRAQSTNSDFWKFTDACRAAPAQMESEQLARRSLFDHGAAV